MSNLCGFIGVTTMSSASFCRLNALEKGKSWPGKHKGTPVTTTEGFTGTRIASIGKYAFAYCYSLASITIPGTVTSIGNYAFYYCTNLKRVFFKGNAPTVGLNVFYGPDNATIYYLPGTTDWGSTFAGRPTRLWNPLIQTAGPGFGVGPGGFGFNITGTVDIPIVVESSTDLANASWVPLQSFNLTNGAFHFSDPDWTNHPSRLYRIRSP